MSSYHEIEFKNLLTLNEYNTLINYFKPSEDTLKIHTNIYFDTKNYDLKQKKCALRARITNNQIELTIKEALDVGILETTDIISENELNMLVENHILVAGEVKKKLSDLKISNEIFDIASLKTFRYEFNYQDNLIALDQSEYYDKIDYEIELETSNYVYGKKVFFELLNQFNIPRRLTNNKIVRALEARKNISI